MPPPAHRLFCSGRDLDLSQARAENSQFTAKSIFIKICAVHLSVCPLGWSLFLKIDLNLMDIKSCVLFTELGRIVVESMVFYIGKSTPRSTHFGGKTMACEVFF